MWRCDGPVREMVFLSVVYLQKFYGWTFQLGVLFDSVVTNTLLERVKACEVNHIWTPFIHNHMEYECAVLEMPCQVIMLFIKNLYLSVNGISVLVQHPDLNSNPTLHMTVTLKFSHINTFSMSYLPYCHSMGATAGRYCTWLLYWLHPGSTHSHAPAANRTH